MPAYVLYGIDKHLDLRFICLSPAKNICEAAERLNGNVDAVKLPADSPLRHRFDARQECAVFNPGSGTFEDRDRLKGKYVSFVIASLPRTSRR